MYLNPLLCLKGFTISDLENVLNYVYYDDWVRIIESQTR